MDPDPDFGASGTIAGLYARLDAARGTWKAPAGTDARLYALLEETLYGGTQWVVFEPNGEPMTQNDIDNGRVIIEIGFAPLEPAEFVIIRIQQFAAGPQ